jgi:intermediate filament protein if
MSTKGQTRDEEITTYRPKTTQKSVIITRSSGGPRTSLGRQSGIGFGSMSRSSQSLSFAPGVYSKMSATGISEFRGNREKEKRDMQDCNERLASYIEKVR